MGYKTEFSIRERERERERELICLLHSCSFCHVSLLAVPLAGLWYLIVVFPGHTLLPIMTIAL